MLSTEADIGVVCCSNKGEMKNSFDIFYITAPLLLVTIGLLQYAHGAKNKEIHCYGLYDS